ncbi:MAG: DUF4363 family protein [Clostridia bacterium]|nr:DUF4363 family protein [Clostridia bacterium]
MNRPKMAFIFLGSSILIGIVSLIYIELSCTEMIEKTTQAEISLIKENHPEAEKNFIELIDLFEKHKPVLNLILGQGDTLEIRGDLNTAIYFLNCKDYPTALLHLQECKADLNRIIAGNEPTITTIF